jgi:hypothetical protein
MHFWLQNVGLPGVMVGLALMLTGRAWVLPLTAGSATAVLLGLGTVRAECPAEYQAGGAYKRLCGT